MGEDCFQRWGSFLLLVVRMTQKAAAINPSAYRYTCNFENSDAYDVDYLDYH